MFKMIEENSTGSYKVRRYDNGDWALLSYDTIIITTNGETISLDAYFHDFSRTTSKHIGIFLRKYTDFQAPKDLRKACENHENEKVRYQLFRENNNLYPIDYPKSVRHLSYHEF